MVILSLWLSPEVFCTVAEQWRGWMTCDTLPSKAAFLWVWKRDKRKPGTDVRTLWKTEGTGLFASQGWALWAHAHAVALLLILGYVTSIWDRSSLSPYLSLLQELHLIAYFCRDLLFLFLSCCPLDGDNNRAEASSTAAAALSVNRF